MIWGNTIESIIAATVARTLSQMTSMSLTTLTLNKPAVAMTHKEPVSVPMSARTTPDPITIAIEPTVTEHVEAVATPAPESKEQKPKLSAYAEERKKVMRASRRK